MKNEMKRWIDPEYDEYGMTQWYWRVTHRDNFKLGANVQIGSFTMIDAQEGVEIEDDVKIGYNCAILSYSSIGDKSGRVILHRGCNIGSNSVIMPFVEVGEDAIIGANSLVNRDIPRGEIWTGSPVRFKRKV